MTKRAGIYILSMVCVLIWAPTVCRATDQSDEPLSAEEQARSDSLISEGVEHYSNRRYEEAIESFKAALELQNEPELLYNIARSYERLVESEKALEWYERLLETPGTTGEIRTKALNNIAALRRELDAKKSAEEAARGSEGSDGPESDADSDGKESDDPTTSNGSIDEPDPQAAQQKEKLSPLGLAGWITTGIGAAGMITGSIFGALAIKTNSDYETTGYDSDRLDYRDDVKRNALIFDITFPVGAVLVATGVSLLVVNKLRSSSGNESDGHTQSSRFLPSIEINRNSLSCGLAGRF